MPRVMMYGVMMFMLEEQWQQKLAMLPESGMDYQIVDIELHSGKTYRNVPVISCRMIHSEVFFNDEDIRDIRMSR